MSKKPDSFDFENEPLPPFQAATLLWEWKGWYVRYPDKLGRAKRIKLSSAERCDAMTEAEAKLPKGVVWIIA